MFVMGTDQVWARIGLHEIQIDPENGVCYTTAYGCLSRELIGLRDLENWLLPPVFPVDLQKKIRIGDFYNQTSFTLGNP